MALGEADRPSCAARSSTRIACGFSMSSPSRPLPSGRCPIDGPCRRPSRRGRTARGLRPRDDAQRAVLRMHQCRADSTMRRSTRARSRSPRSRGWRPAAPHPVFGDVPVVRHAPTITPRTPERAGRLSVAEAQTTRAGWRRPALEAGRGRDDDHGDRRVPDAVLGDRAQHLMAGTARAPLPTTTMDADSARATNTRPA